MPHAERGDEVAIGKDFNKQMLALHLRANRKETVVGWYASAALGDVEGEEAPDLIANTSSIPAPMLCPVKPLVLVMTMCRASSPKALRKLSISAAAEPPLAGV